MAMKQLSQWNGSFVGATRRIVVLLLVASLVLPAFAPATASAAPTKKADIVFVIDDTASLGSQIDAVTDNIEGLAQGVAGKNVDARYALVTFKDTTEVDQDFTGDVNTVKSALSAVTATGGGDRNEVAYDGIGTALDLSWRSDAAKIVVVVTNVPSHYEGDGTPYSTYTPAEIRQRITDEEAVLVSISENYDDPEDSTKTLAEDTGGFWLDFATDDYSVIVEDLLGIVDDVAQEAPGEDEDDEDRPGAEFEVTDVAWSTQTPTVGEEVSVTFTVENVGGSEGWFKGNVHSDFTPVDRQIAELDAGESHDFTVNVTWDQRGDHRLFVRTHYLGEVTVVRDDG